MIDFIGFNFGLFLVGIIGQTKGVPHCSDWIFIYESKSLWWMRSLLPCLVPLILIIVHFYFSRVELLYLLEFFLLVLLNRFSHFCPFLLAIEPHLLYFFHLFSLITINFKGCFLFCWSSTELSTRTCWSLLSFLLPILVFSGRFFFWLI